jgi:short-subunit dehydrogenase
MQFTYPCYPCNPWLNCIWESSMRREFTGRRVLITGASSGIGRALTMQLAQAGARLALAARSKDKLDALASELLAHGADVVAIPVDVTLEADRAHLMAEVQTRFGGLDVLVNNAGIASWAHFADSTEEILRQIMEVNFFAPTELIRLAIPMLTEGQQPAIVNVSSMCGRRAMPGWSEYSASKYALCGLTEALRGELARFEIDILLIIPGLTKSDFPKHFLQTKGRAKIEFDKGMPPEQVAAGILNSLRKNKTETVMGSEARWVLLCNKFFPRLTDWLLARKMKQLYKTV